VQDDKEYGMGGWSGDVRLGREVGIQAGRFELDANARHFLARLAVARINMGEIGGSGFIGCGKCRFSLISSVRMILGGRYS
jgi:hypothetical protein